MDLYSNEYSSNDNEDSFSDTDDVDNFLHYNSDYIYSLYEDLQNRFSFISPAFLCNMRFHHIINFLCDLVLYKTSEYRCQNKIILERFKQMYSSELEISYDIVYRFLKHHFKFSIQYKDWLVFCYRQSAKYEIYTSTY